VARVEREAVAVLVFVGPRVAEGATVAATAARGVEAFVLGAAAAVGGVVVVAFGELRAAACVAGTRRDRRGTQSTKNPPVRLRQHDKTSKALETRYGARDDVTGGDIPGGDQARAPPECAPWRHTLHH